VAIQNTVARTNLRRNKIAPYEFMVRSFVKLRITPNGRWLRGRLVKLKPPPRRAGEQSLRVRMLRRKEHVSRGALFDD